MSLCEDCDVLDSLPEFLPQMLLHNTQSYTRQKHSILDAVTGHDESVFVKRLSV